MEGRRGEPAVVFELVACPEVLRHLVQVLRSHCQIHGTRLASEGWAYRPRRVVGPGLEMRQAHLESLHSPEVEHTGLELGFVSFRLFSVLRRLGYTLIVIHAGTTRARAVAVRLVCPRAGRSRRCLEEVGSSGGAVSRGRDGFEDGGQGDGA